MCLLLGWWVGELVGGWVGGLAGWRVGGLGGWGVGGWVGGWWLGGWVVGWLGGWVVGWVGGWVGGWVVGWLGGWVVGWLGGWVVGWLGGWLVGWVGGWVGWCALAPWFPNEGALNNLMSQAESGCSHLVLFLTLAKNSSCRLDSERCEGNHLRMRCGSATLWWAQFWKLQRWHVGHSSYCILGDMPYYVSSTFPRNPNQDKRLGPS